MAFASIVNSTGNGLAMNVPQAITTTFRSQVITGNSSITSATIGYGGPRRGKWSDLLIGTQSAPGDTALQFDVVRATLSATNPSSGIVLISSLSSSFMLDPADAGFVAFCGINSSVETNLAVLAEPWNIGINQRASYRWVAAPGSEIVYPASSSSAGNNALSLRATSLSYTGLVTATVIFNEQ